MMVMNLYVQHPLSVPLSEICRSQMQYFEATGKLRICGLYIIG